MSRQEAVEAYLSGSLGRRAFIRRMVAAGASLTAAVAAADTLRAAPSTAALPPDDVYDDVYPTPAPTEPPAPPAEEPEPPAEEPEAPAEEPEAPAEEPVEKPKAPAKQLVVGRKAATGGDTAVSALPSTGAGDESEESGGFLKPISLMASAAAAALAFRMRQLRKTESEPEAE